MKIGIAVYVGGYAEVHLALRQKYRDFRLHPVRRHRFAYLDTVLYIGRCAR